MKTLIRLAVIVALISFTTVLVHAQPKEADTAKPATAPPSEAKPADPQQQSAEDVLNQLLKKRAENPLIDPSPAGGGKPPAARATGQAVGIAPGGAATLRREGQFIVTRRARMVRAAGAPGTTTPWMVAFDADGSNLADPPMYLMPCQLLEDMETVLQQHGESMVFILSGQIYVYRNSNYLLPTLMKLAPQKSNLQP